jgi:hypothetical protein
MSSNFLIWNPSGSNQETDTEYSGDAQRTGGFQTNQLVPSPLLNKVLFQASTMVTALADALVVAGYSPQDSSLSALTAMIVAAFGVNAGLQELAYTATPAWNGTAYSTFEMTLTGNVTSQTFTGLTAGQTITFIWKQSGSGGYTVAYPSNFYGFSKIYANGTSVQSGKVDAEGNVWASSPMLGDTP